MAQTRKRGNHF